MIKAFIDAFKTATAAKLATNQQDSYKWVSFRGDGGEEIGFITKEGGVLYWRGKEIGPLYHYLKGQLDAPEKGGKKKRKKAIQ